MGWSNGTDLVRAVAEAIKKHVKDSKVRVKLYVALVEAAQNQDWDCDNEAEGIDPLLDKIVAPDDSEDD